MRATVARRLRKLVYGADDSPRFRKYRLFQRGHSLRTMPDGKGYKNIFVQAYFIISDPQRRKYQKLKRDYLNGGLL